MKNTFNIAITIISFLPLLFVGLFADPTQGVFSKSLGTLITLFIAGCLASFVIIKYGKVNGLGASLVWGGILAAGLGLATCF